MLFRSYFFIADVDETTPVSGTFSLTANYVGPAQCQMNQTTCQSSTKLGYCVSPGLYQDYTCTGGCNNGRCGSPTGEICADPIDASAGGTFTVDPTQSSDDYDLPSFGGCAGDDTPGPDTVYRVDLQPGEILDATLTPQNSTDDPVLYAVDTCGDAQDVIDSCVAGADANFGGSAESIRLKAPSGSSASYWLIADSDDPNQASGKWDLKVTKTQPTCTPGSASCSGSDTLQYCDAWGTGTKTFTCQGMSSPTCQSGRCKAPTGNICADYVDASGGGSFTGDYSTLTDDFEMPDSSCVGDATPAPDQVYRFTAMAGQTITAKVTPQGNDDPAVYITDSCYGVVTRASSVCLAGDDSNFSGTADSASYTVPSGQGGTYWVFLDGDDRSQASGQVTVDITIQ